MEPNISAADEGIIDPGSEAKSDADVDITVSIVVVSKLVIVALALRTSDDRAPGKLEDAAGREDSDIVLEERPP